MTYAIDHVHRPMTAILLVETEAQTKPDMENDPR